MRSWLQPNEIYQGDSKVLMTEIAPNSIALSFWSPPYHVGKEYERDMSFEEWMELLRVVIGHHARILKPGSFLVINIADILCFRDSSMPRLMAENISRKRSPITRAQVEAVWQAHPDWSRKQVAAYLGCSEQTVQRRLLGNNVRGGKYESQTRVRLVGGLLEEMAGEACLYLYDRRVWVKDAAWENSRWHTMSYRSVDEFEYLFFFWKPGITRVDRHRLTPDEWKSWGSRAVWFIPSVRANNDHEAKFPLELPRRVIRLLTDPGDIVLDCFLGSGTTAVAALLEHRNFIGIEIMPQYVEMAQRACDIAMQQVAAELLPFEEECPLAPKQSHSNNRQYRLEIQEAPPAEKELSR
jgi:DNA modification methylase